MTNVLIASDADYVIDDVAAALTGPDTTLRVVRAGQHVRPAVQRETPDLAILDFQIGNMGAMAACVDLRHESGAGRLDHVPVMMLLDREADIFLAQQSDAQGWLVKPLDAFRLRRAVDAVLAGTPWFEGLPEPESSDDEAEPDIIDEDTETAEEATD